MMTKFKIIYADPAWQFRTWSEKGEDRSPKYTKMNLADLKSICVEDIADDDSILLMWATYPMLKQSIELMEAWGFEYKTVAFTWIKLIKKWRELLRDWFTKRIKSTLITLPQLVQSTHRDTHNLWHMGNGYYTRANPEIVLLGTKGKGVSRIHKGIRNLVIYPINEHSEKPAEIRTRITKLYGDQPRIELFARELVDGWTCIGDEINTSIEEYIEKYIE